MSEKLSVSQAAALIVKPEGKPVTPRYLQAEIKAGRLKAELITPPAGRTYYMIDPDDLKAWQVNRPGRQYHPRKTE